MSITYQSFGGMFLRLVPYYNSTLQVRICISKVYQCPFFVFRPRENSIGGWHNGVLSLSKLNQPRRFTSLLEVFLFLRQDPTAHVPMDLTGAFCWSRGDCWDDQTARPFRSFLKTHACYVHNEPPYQLYYLGFGPKTRMSSSLSKPKPESIKKRCCQAWADKTAFPIHTTSNSSATHPLWTRFLTRHRILDPSDQTILFGPS